jgi:hypothetical protein
MTARGGEAIADSEVDAVRCKPRNVALLVWIREDGKKDTRRLLFGTIEDKRTTPK